MLGQRRTEVLLEPLARLVGGSISNDRLRGNYERFAVEAWGVRERPSHPRIKAINPEGPVREGPPVNIFKIRLTGVPGGQFWDCRSAPTLLSKAIPEVLTSLTYRMMRAEFAFERPLGGSLARKLGVPPADDKLEQRLRGAGLLDELASLRWGRHPYLPQARFNPGVQAVGVDDLVSRMEEGLRTAGHSELAPALDAGVAPRSGELVVEVEVGKAKIPTEEQFRHLLNRVVRIAQINAEVNRP